MRRGGANCPVCNYPVPHAPPGHHVPARRSARIPPPAARTPTPPPPVARLSDLIEISLDDDPPPRARRPPRAPRRRASSARPPRSWSPTLAAALARGRALLARSASDHDCLGCAAVRARARVRTGTAAGAGAGAALGRTASAGAVGRRS